ncbi:glycerophosphodiester phosphodiesterase family protein [Hoeflea prorocentri]|uniref:glycerophosphodiester phosphodiesterase n=1 Tax=Hoeflea prorocentri TaxID=1922333 RepID=A0A9X3ZH43_9HYPH|nr:glycerophosphodiester phosphodiesterase family protein [Hoeflea prorocentri]MCY6381432.1 glycerophosphodiester phosphodiesterase family protein [Hoeflea prorocentri]MDA5399232.1 glycerophosphodiester phosphodiesterase family protein [Hoeflea prorocentri]
MKPVIALFSLSILLSTFDAAPVMAKDGSAVQLGPRPFFLMKGLEDGELKEALKQCESGPFYKSDFSIGHRGAPLQFPEHTEESYRAAARMGAGILECDVTFTKDRELVCRHSQCDLHTTTDILLKPEIAASCSVPFSPADAASGKKAEAKCCTSDITLEQFRQLTGKMESSDRDATTVEQYVGGNPGWRTDLYSTRGRLMTLAESINLFEELGAKHTPELKSAGVAMPFEGDFTQEDYAQKMIDAYKAAGVPADRVFAQSFNPADVAYWIANEPDFGAQAIYLDGRFRNGIDPEDAATWTPSMEALKSGGFNYIAPPLWMLVKTGDDGRPAPSAYAKAAKKAGLEIIAWTVERSGTLTSGGGWYYQTIADITNNDSDTLVLLDVLAKDVGVAGVFSDWPATTTYYANCMGL